jgi:hypothetical protein
LAEVIGDVLHELRRTAECGEVGCKIVCVLMWCGCAAGVGRRGDGRLFGVCLVGNALRWGGVKVGVVGGGWRCHRGLQ